MDAVAHRCPLFSRQLGSNPAETLALDTLHTLYYGPIMRWTSAALWRLIKANPWNLCGTRDVLYDVACRRLTADMVHWFEQNEVPHDRRIGELTPKMLGDYAVGPSEAHPGGALKLKAAETGLLMSFALHELGVHGGGLLQSAELVRAGRSLVRYMQIIRESGIILSHAKLTELMECAQRHLVDCERCGIAYSPKHHLFVHLTIRSRRMGNPRYYSCFVDESLNMILRTVAQFAHRATLEVRVFTMFHLRGSLRLGKYLFSPNLNED
jgi:hypothetical protein